MKKFFVVLMISLMAIPAFAATKHWKGTVNRDFTDLANWSDTTVFTGSNDGAISLADPLSPIMYSTSASLNTTRNLYVGGTAYGELEMQGGSIRLNRVEIGNDYMLSGVGADGAMTMSGGTFTTNANALIGTGNTGSLTISGGNFNITTFLTVGELGARSSVAGSGTLTMTNGSITADRAYVGKGAGAVGLVELSGTSSIALNTFIFVGDADAAATVILRNSATITGGNISLRTGSVLDFVIDTAFTASRMDFTTLDSSTNFFGGTINVAFEDAAVNGTYNLISFAADMSGTDISTLLSSQSVSAGWSLDMVGDGNGGSILQATYIPEPATLIILACGSIAVLKRNRK